MWELIIIYSRDHAAFSGHWTRWEESSTIFQSWIWWRPGDFSGLRLCLIETHHHFYKKVKWENSNSSRHNDETKRLGNMDIWEKEIARRNLHVPRHLPLPCRTLSRTIWGQAVGCEGTLYNQVREGAGILFLKASLWTRVPNKVPSTKESAYSSVLAYRVTCSSFMIKFWRGTCVACLWRRRACISASLRHRSWR